MPIVAKQIDAGSTLEQIRQQFNNLQSDVETLQASPTYGTAIIFEGTTNDDFETSLTAQDPTADRTIYLPNLSGYLLTDESAIKSTTSEITANNSTNETVYITFVDGATGEQGLESDTGLTYNPSTNALNLGSIVISNGSTIGSASDQDAITISSAGLVTLSAAAALSVTGTSTFNEDVHFDGVTAGRDVLWDKDANSLEWSDNAKATWGNGGDLQIYHDGSHSYIQDSGTGYLLLTSDGPGVRINSSSDEVMGDFVPNGAVTLYHDNSAKLATSAAGVSVTGTATMSGNVVIADAGTIGSASDTDALAIDASGNVTASQNVTITGNLTVNGTTTTVSTSNTVIGDSLIELNSGAGSNTNDLGIVMERGSTGDNAIIAWDESADKFVFGTTTATGASTGNLTIANGTIVAANIEGTLSTAAQTNITSLGTLTALTVDNVVIDGAVIGHTGDTDLMTLAAGVLTVAGRVDASDDIYLTGDEKKVRWYNGSNYVTLGANSSLSSNIAFTLPSADGSSGQALVTDGSGNFSFASNNVGNATSFTVTANNSTDETVYPIFVDGATGEQNAETDTGLTYNPSTGLLSTAAITLTGALTVGGTTTLNGNLVLGDAAADTLTVGATLQGASPLTFEGGTADGNETTFAITDPTADRTITFPDATGTVSLITATETLTNKTLTSPVINSATVVTSITPASADGATLGTAALEWSDLFLADSATIQFGNDQEIILTHVPDSGIRLHDSDKFMFGDDNDLQIYHNGTHSFIDDSGTGNLYIRSNEVRVNKYTGEAMIRATADADVSLYYDNVLTLSTTATGISVVGDVKLSDDLILDSDSAAIQFGDDQEITLTHVHDVGVQLGDSMKMLFGADSDAGIYHNGSNFYLDNGTGNILAYSDTMQFFSKTGSETFAQFNHNGAVNLYYDNSKKFETTSAGVTITGTVTATAGATLLIKNSSGSTLKTIKGMT